MSSDPKKSFSRVASPEERLSAEQLQKVSFDYYIDYVFGKDSGDQIRDSFDKLGLPAPKNGHEFLAGADGGLVFLNQFGLVIRIEHASANDSIHEWDRVDKSGWVLQPLATIDAGSATIEICPGCNLETDTENLDLLEEQLAKQRINFWDKWLVNVGRIPVATEEFPEGVPVVIDRLAVSRLTDATSSAKKYLENAEHLAAANVQDRLYGPLRKALNDAWPEQQGAPDGKKMKEFWKLCESYVEEGTMVAGWNQAERGSYYKTDIVMDVAERYEVRLKKAGKPAGRKAAKKPSTPKPGG